MKSNRLDVFAASLQCIDEVKIVSRKKDGERGGRFPTMRHEHMLELIGRSHFTAQPDER